MTRRRINIDDEEVRFMSEVEGMTQKEIADYYGCCQMTICNRLHPEKMKERNKKFLLDNPDYSKEYKRDHHDEVNEDNIIYRKEHSKEIKESDKKYRESHSEEIKEYLKQWRLENPEYLKEYNKNWLLEHLDCVKEYKKNWWLTDNGMLCKKNAIDKRRDLGFIPLNNHFDGGVWHHIDEEHVICIPEELHKSIWHNVRTGQGMEAINEIAFGYIIEETFDKLIAGEI